MVDLVTEVNAVLSGRVGFAPYDSTSNRNVPEGVILSSDEELTLLEAGERNAVSDNTSFDEDVADDGEFFDDVGYERQLLSQLAAEQAEYEATERQSELLSMRYVESCEHPFFSYQDKCGVCKPASQTRSEVYEVAGSLGGRVRHVNTGKHQQFYGHLRIH